jgi:hypothetical protein
MNDGDHLRVTSHDLPNGQIRDASIYPRNRTLDRAVASATRNKLSGIVLACAIGEVGAGVGGWDAGGVSPLGCCRG